MRFPRFSLFFLMLKANDSVHKGLMKLIKFNISHKDPFKIKLTRYCSLYYVQRHNFLCRQVLSSRHCLRVNNVMKKNYFLHYNSWIFIDDDDDDVDYFEQFVD